VTVLIGAGKRHVHIAGLHLSTIAGAACDAKIWCYGDLTCVGQQFAERDSRKIVRQLRHARPPCLQREIVWEKSICLPSANRWAFRRQRGRMLEDFGQRVKPGFLMTALRSAFAD
jgi:hypothetical protein